MATAAFLGADSIRAFVRRFKVTCATCGSRPSACEVWLDPSGGIAIDYDCHGDSERVLIEEHRDPGVMLRAIPRRVFLRRMATTGPMSAGARRERRGRRRR